MSIMALAEEGSTTNTQKITVVIITESTKVSTSMNMDTILRMRDIVREIVTTKNTTHGVIAIVLNVHIIMAKSTTYSVDSLEITTATLNSTTLKYHSVDYGLAVAIAMEMVITERVLTLQIFT